MNVVPREKREQGMPGARCTRGLVCKECTKKRTRAYRFSGGNPAFPARWSYGLCRALPGERIRLVTVAAGLMADTIRLDRYSHRQLGTSNGCRDHTVLPYAATSATPSASQVPATEVLAKAFKRRSSAQWRVAHRPKPAPRLPAAPTLPRPPHPIPRS
jgi:hypothetical protein